MNNTDHDEIRPIRSVGELEEVYRLTHDSYVSQSYTEAQPNGLLLHYPEYDVIPETTVLGVYRNGALIASVSLTVPGPFGYTIDHDYGENMRSLRQEGRTVGVIWRLIVREEFRSITVVKKLITAVTRMSMSQGVNTFVFEVNPKHQRVYERLFNMTLLTRKEGAKGLKHAPAVLLRTDYENVPTQWRLADYVPQARDLMGLTLLERLLDPLPEAV